MIIGRMDRELKILRRVEVGRTELNSPIYEWQHIATEWAEIVHKSEDERFAASQRYAERIVTFRIYFRDDFTEADRLECEGRQYDIKGIRELGYRESLEIAAEWQTPD